MIKKYIKKPVEVEAIQLTESNIEDVLAFICDGHNFDMCSDITKEETISLIKANNFYITVNETDVRVSLGDYIIKGHNNLFYKIPAKEFEATYEEVKSRSQNERLKLRSLEEILSKIEEYGSNIKFLDEQLVDEEVKEELKKELVILKWCVGLVERI